MNRANLGIRKFNIRRSRYFHSVGKFVIAFTEPCWYTCIFQQMTDISLNTSVLCFRWHHVRRVVVFSCCKTQTNILLCCVDVLGFWRRVDSQVDNDVSEKHAVSICRD
jgi:hypothetical protein